MTKKYVKDSFGVFLTSIHSRNYHFPFLYDKGFFKAKSFEKERLRLSWTDKMKKILVFLGCILVLSISFGYLIYSGEKLSLILSDKNLTQKEPGLKPEVYAPGIVSMDDRVEFCCAFTPEGEELFFTQH